MRESTFDEISLGMSASFKRKITSKEMQVFSDLTEDRNPLHLDKAYANERGFDERVVFGLLINSYLSTLAGMHLPGKYALILSVESQFKRSCLVNEVITISGEVVAKISANKVLIIKTDAKKDNGEVVMEGKMYVQVLK